MMYTGPPGKEILCRVKSPQKRKLRGMCLIHSNPIPLTFSLRLSSFVVVGLLFLFQYGSFFSSAFFSLAVFVPFRVIGPKRPDSFAVLLACYLHAAAAANCTLLSRPIPVSSHVLYTLVASCGCPSFFVSPGLQAHQFSRFDLVDLWTRSTLSLPSPPRFSLAWS